MAGDGEKAQALSQPIPDDIPVERAGEGVPAWIPLPPMPEAPKVEPSVVDSAITKLNGIGGEHVALVQSWGSDASENLAYAFEAFKDIAANKPDLIAKFYASGLGNDPSVIEFLAKHGRLHAGLMGDFTVARNSAPSFDEPQQAMPRGQSAAQRELNKIFQETPPGTEGYKDKAVQDRIRKLSEMIHGDGPAVGHGGRTLRPGELYCQLPFAIQKRRTAAKPPRITSGPKVKNTSMSCTKLIHFAYDLGGDVLRQSFVLGSRGMRDRISPAGFRVRECSRLPAPMATAAASIDSDAVGRGGVAGLLIGSRGRPRSGSLQNLIFECHAFGVIFFEPCFRGGDVYEYLEMIGITDPACSC
jgi:hypothetical protein